MGEERQSFGENGKKPDLAGRKAPSGEVLVVSSHIRGKGTQKTGLQKEEKKEGRLYVR